MMKKVVKGSVAALMVLLMSAGLGLAANGNGGGGQGTCGGTGISIVCSGTPVEFTGVVSDISYAGSGMEVTTDDGPVIVYGIGPYRYWDKLAIDRPAVGDTVTVSGMVVDFNGTLKIVAMSITVGDQTAQLREPCVGGTGGQPLWRGLRQNQQQ
jgi:hypothetical protein